MDIAKYLFQRYSQNGRLSRDGFVQLLTSLHDRFPTLRIIPTVAGATFDLVDRDHDGYLRYEEFRSWWVSEDRFSNFSGERSQLLAKAYLLYRKYTDDKMKMEEFTHLLEDMGLRGGEEDFDRLDLDENGVLTFDEFCGWLRWF